MWVLRLALSYAFATTFVAAAIPLSFPSVISSGREESSSWSATITVEQHRHVNNQVSFNTRSYCYESICSYPGPTIIVQPGDNFTLTLVNRLGNDPDSDYIMNTMHGANNTNIHTHGIHVDPKVDNVFLVAGPGEELVYPYQIPKNHAPGTHWYHAHYHGSSAFQIMGGLVGALLVRPTPSQNIPASITDADSYLLVITHLKFDQEVSTRTGLINQGCGRDMPCDPIVQAPLCTAADTEPASYESFRVYSYLELGVDVGNTMAIEEVFVDESVQDMKLVNGQYMPLLVLVQKSFSILRVVSATGGGQLALSIGNDNNSVCSMQVIAYDGVYLDKKLPKKSVKLVEGGRADVQVMCEEAGSFTLLDDESSAVLMLLEVTAEGEIKPPVTDDELSAIVKPPYLADLMSDSIHVDSYYSMHTWRNGLNHSICGHWMGSGYNCSALEPMGPQEPNVSSHVCPFNQFEGERGLNPVNYTSKYKLVTPMNAVNEWTIYGMGNDQHPMHIHVHHMQVIHYIGDGSGNSVEHDEFFLPGQWRDTLPAFQGQLTVRFRTADFWGENVIHCHFLRHEDLGMMDSFLVEEPPRLYTDNNDDADSLGAAGGWWRDIHKAYIVAVVVVGMAAVVVLGIHFKRRQAVQKLADDEWRARQSGLYFKESREEEMMSFLVYDDKRDALNVFN